MDFANLIEKELRNILKQLDYPSEVSFVVEIPRDNKNGDYATNIAMQLTKILRQNPRIIAENIVNHFNKNNANVNEIVIANPGFINFFVNNSSFSSLVEKVLTEDKNYGNTNYGKMTKYNVEFVSANPTGDLHLGHARQAAIADSICRLLTAAGFDVTREYYINDAGNQIQTLAKSIYLRYQQALGIDVDFIEDGYHGKDIIDFANKLKETHQDSLLNKPLDYFKTIGVEYELSKIIKDIDYFRVHFDIFTHELMLYEKGWVDNVIPLLQKLGYTYEKDGAIWFKTTSFEDDKDRVLRKSDGSYTYLTPDIAYHKYKFERGFDYVIDVLGADHHGYIKRMEAAITALGYKKEQLKIIIMQMVRLIKDGQEVKMSKRTGKAYTLRDLCEEIGVDATRYYFASKSISSHMDLNLDDAVKQSNENPVYYIQYAHARCCSVLDAYAKISKDIDSSATLLDDKKEISLLKHINEFEKIIIDAALNYAPYKITNYLYTLAQLFHGFYNDCKIIDENNKELTAQRIALIKITRIVIRNGLNLIGVNALEKM